MTYSIAFVVYSASRIASGKSNIATTPGHLSRRCLLAVGYLPSHRQAATSSSSPATASETSVGETSTP